jgi:DUF4097 and DUF4098 domain-containing protein YvlB
MKAATKPGVSILWVVLLFGLSATNALAQDNVFEESLTISGPFVLDVDTGSGSIQVRSGSGDEITVKGKINVNRRFWGGKPANADEIVQEIIDNPPIEVSDGRLRVGQFSDRSLRKKVSVSYEIVVPSSTEVVAESGSGSIRVTDISAPVDAHAGSGNVKLENISASVKARTGSGSITADGVGGAFNGSTGSGSITLLQTAPGDVDVSTGSGSSELKGVVGSVRASAGSGRITVEGRQTGDWKLDTGSGSVRVTLPDDAAFELDAESSSSGIDIDHPLTVQGHISKRHITGQVRGGGPLLRIDTGSGGIRIR